MRFPATAICFLLPLLSAAQTACPADPTVYRCLYPPACDFEDRRELVQVLMSHNEMLLAASPGLTPTEQDSYQAELDSGDGNRFVAAVQSDAGSRIAVRSALEEQRRMLIYLNILLTEPMYSPEGQPAARRVELRRWQQAAWVQLGRLFADSGWLPAWGRLRDSPDAPGTRVSAFTTKDDIETCSVATRAVLQLVLDDFRAYSSD